MCTNDDKMISEIDFLTFLPEIPEPLPAPIIPQALKILGEVDMTTNVPRNRRRKAHRVKKNKDKLFNNRMQKLQQYLHQTNAQIITNKRTIQPQLGVEAKYTIIATESTIYSETYQDVNVIKVKNRGIHILEPDWTPLTEADTDILSMGLKFIMNTINTSNDDISTALNRYIRSIKLRILFRDVDTSNQSAVQRCIRIPNPNYQPVVPHSAALNIYCEAITNRIQSKILRYPNINTRMPTTMFNAMTNLINNKDIMICNADKNQGVCVITTNSYNLLAHNHLNNPHLYRTITEQEYQHINNDNYNYISQLSPNFYTGDRTVTMSMLIKYLLHNHKKWKPGRNYFLPKVHKDKKNYVDPATNIAKLLYPMRPITSTCGTALYNTSIYVTTVLRPIELSLQYVVSSTIESLFRTKDIILSPSDVLCGADVSDLFTNMDIESTIQSVVNKVHAHNTSFPAHTTASKDLIGHLLARILRSNTSQFNGTYYIQTNGAAMGHPCIPPVANIFLDAVETDAFKAITNHCIANNIDIITMMPKVYIRLMDDIFGIFPSEEAWKLFIDIFNTRRETIKITHSCSSTNAVFLDIEYFRGPDNKLETRLYRKPNNSYLYIPHSSMHNPTIHKSWIINERKRCKIICSNNDDYIAAELLFRSKLPDRGYPPHILEMLFNAPIPTRNEMTTIAYAKISTRISNIQNHVNISKLVKTPLLFCIPYSTRATKFDLKNLLTPEDIDIRNEMTTINHGDYIPIICYKTKKSFKNILNPSIPRSEILTNCQLHSLFT